MTQDKDEILLPCPFCGGKPKEYIDSAIIICSGKCLIEMHGSCPDEARELWNTRKGSHDKTKE